MKSRYTDFEFKEFPNLTDEFNEQFFDELADYGDNLLSKANRILEKNEKYSLTGRGESSGNFPLLELKKAKQEVESVSKPVSELLWMFQNSYAAGFYELQYTTMRDIEGVRRCRAHACDTSDLHHANLHLTWLCSDLDSHMTNAIHEEEPLIL